MIHFIASLDIRVLDLLYAYRNLTITDVFIGFTELGETIFAGGLIVCLVLYFALRRKYAYLAGLLVSAAGATATTLILKQVVARARPDIFYRAYPESGFSFPSGHATIAVAFYGFCIFLVRRLVPNPLWRNAAMAFLTFLILGIAFSRMYLGVHNMSDVVAGLAVGGLFVWIGHRIVMKMER